MDNLGRDAERMMYALVIGGALAGAAAMAGIIWLARRFSEMAAPHGPHRPQRQIERSRFGLALLSLRLERGWTQEALGAAVGVNRNVVVRWETDRNDPSARHLKRLADVFRVSMDDLWTGRAGTESRR